MEKQIKQLDRKTQEAISFFEFFRKSKNPLYNAVKSSLRSTLENLRAGNLFKSKKNK